MAIRTLTAAAPVLRVPPRRRPVRSLEISLLVSTFQRPYNLRRTLLSIAQQEGVTKRFELIVTDDGSRDATSALVANFARQVDFPVAFTTHPHDGFQLARCRNEGVAASQSPYVLFLDGDCVLPRDHVAKHLRHRTAGVVMAGGYYYLQREVTEDIGDAEVRGGDFRSWPSLPQRRHLAAKQVRSYFYRMFRLPNRPRLTGGNVGIWREDFQRVNGYNQNFVGWGFEDRDLQCRLSRLGVRFHSSLGWTRSYHLWHPHDPSFARNGEGTQNRHLFYQAGRLTKTRCGLRQRSLDDVAIQVFWPSVKRELAAELLSARFTTHGERPEVELVFSPGEGQFSGRADCNFLVVLQQRPPRHLVRQAHILVSDEPLALSPGRRQFPLRQFEQALAAIG